MPATVMARALKLSLQLTVPGEFAKDPMSKFWTAEQPLGTLKLVLLWHWGELHRYKRRSFTGEAQLRLERLSSAMEHGRYWIAQFGEAGEHAGVERETWVSASSSSTQAILKPSRLLIDSAVSPRTPLKNDQSVARRHVGIIT